MGRIIPELVMNNGSEQTYIHFTWRLPDGSRARATFLADVVSYEAAKDRWLCQLRSITTSLDAIPVGVANYIRALPGKWVFIPTEGRNGMTLPLKLETLLGKPLYFRDHDPRSSNDV